MLQPPLFGSRLQEPNGALYAFGVERLGRVLSEGGAELVAGYAARWGGILDCLEEGAVEVAVGVDDVAGRHVDGGDG